MWRAAGCVFSEEAAAVKELHLNAYAKINLTLDVLADRPDGYHDIETILHTVELHDSITLREDGDGIAVRCASPDIPADTQNIVHRAAALLKETFRVPRGVEVELTKCIPIAAGLGGGSSDAAVTLLGLAQMWKLRLGERQLVELAGQIGSDVPFFLAGGAALAMGRGERIRSLRPLPTTWVVLARPRLQISTEWAYGVLDHAAPRRRRPDTPAVIRALDAENPVEVGRLLCNVFEEVVEAHHPAVRALRERMAAQHPLGVSMSGTGPVMFALAAKESEARALGESLAGDPECEVFITRTFAEQR